MRWPYRFLLAPLLLGLCESDELESHGVETDGEMAGMEKISIKPFNYTEEEDRSVVIPEGQRCDACRATIFQLQKTLDGVRILPAKELKEKYGSRGAQEQAARIAQALEGACSKETFDEYGLKDVDGVRHLNGPGIEKPGMGIIRGGSNWPQRLKSVCEGIVGEAEEEGVLLRWRAKTLDGLCDKACGRAPLRAKKKKKTEEPKKETKDTKKKKEKKKKELDGLQDLPSPPYSMRPIDRAGFPDFLTGKILDINHRMKRALFHVVLFHDATAQSAQAVQTYEIAARLAKKSKLLNLRKTAFARYDGRKDTYLFKMDSLPVAILYRKGYKLPKYYFAKEYGWREPEKVIEWLTKEVEEVYMKDADKDNPRGAYEMGAQKFNINTAGAKSGDIIKPERAEL